MRTQDQKRTMVSVWVVCSKFPPPPGLTCRWRRGRRCCRPSADTRPARRSSSTSRPRSRSSTTCRSASSRPTDSCRPGCPLQTNHEPQLSRAFSCKFRKNRAHVPHSSSCFVKNIFFRRDSVLCTFSCFADEAFIRGARLVGPLTDGHFVHHDAITATSLPNEIVYDCSKCTQNVKRSQVESVRD